VRINGTIVQEGGRLVSGRIEGSMDTRGLDGLVGGGTGATCALLTSLGVNCEPCPDGSGTYCLTTIMEDIIAQPARSRAPTPRPATSTPPSPPSPAVRSPPGPPAGIAPDA